MHVVIMSRKAPAGKLCEPVLSSTSRSAQSSNTVLIHSQASLSPAGGNAIRGKHSMVGADSVAVCTNSLSAMTLCWDGGSCDAESVLRPFKGASGAVGAAVNRISCLRGVLSVPR